MKEIWKDISGYEGFYQVSTKGRIRSVQRKVKNGANSFVVLHSVIRKQCVDFKRYANVMLHKNGRVSTKKFIVWLPRRLYQTRRINRKSTIKMA